MTKEEAEKYAENMAYREAIYNLKQAKSVPYRKATFIKVNELINELEQEPMVKIDLYSVIKQKYIEREVLDKISAEIYNAIEFERKWLCDAGHTSKDIDIALNAIKSKVKDVLEKGAESEGVEE